MVSVTPPRWDERVKVKNTAEVEGKRLGFLISQIFKEGVFRKYAVIILELYIFGKIKKSQC